MSEWNRPRALALAILEDVEQGKGHAEDLLDRELVRRPDLDPRDRGLATELVYGVLRRQSTLDHVIAGKSKTPLGKLERRIHLALRLGLYQLLWLDRVPASAAINETVKLTGSDPRRRGFTNGVLRAIDRSRPDLGFDEIAKWDRRMALRHSHPLWLVRMWERELGRERTEAILAANNEPARIVVRANLLKTNRAELLGLLERAETPGKAGVLTEEAVVITRGGSIRESAFWRTGLMDIQDEASQTIAALRYRLVKVYFRNSVQVVCIIPTLLGSPGFSLDLATCPGVLLMHFFLLGKQSLT